jgi:hypothetical protein
MPRLACYSQYGRAKQNPCTPNSDSDANRSGVFLLAAPARARGVRSAGLASISHGLHEVKKGIATVSSWRLLTLEDTIEFFNLILELKLTAQEKKDLVAFLRVL